MDMEQELLKQIYSADIQQRRAAIVKLRDSQYQSAVDPLISFLNDPSNIIRRSTAKTLGVLGAERAFEPLVEVFEDDLADDVRNAALGALVNIDSVRAIAYLQNALNDISAEIRHKAIRILRNIGSEQTASLLTEALNDPNEHVRRSALDGLGNIISSDQKFVVDALIASALEDSDSHARIAAVSALSKVIEQRILETMLEVIQSENEERAKIIAIKYISDALGGTGEIDAVFNQLIDLLSSASQNLRIEAITALGRIGNARAIPPLVELLNDEDGIRQKAVMALGWIRDPAAIDSLLALVDDDDTRIRYLVAEALGKIKDRHGLDVLSTLLDDESRRVRRRAAESIRWIGNFEAFEILAANLLSQPHAVCNHLRNWELDNELESNKAEYIVDNVLAISSISTSSVFYRNCVFLAMLPPRTQNDQQYRQAFDELVETLVKKAARYKDDASTTSLLAELIVYGAGSKDRAAEIINEYEVANKLKPQTFLLLRKYVGGELALEPILAQLQSNLDAHFLEPIDALNEDTIALWKDTVQQAKQAFYTRLFMSIAVFVLGFIFAALALYQFTFGQLERIEAYIGPSVSLLAGLTSIVATFYSGPLKEVRKSITDLGTIHTAFIGYMHIVLEISQTFAALVLQQKVDFTEMDKSYKMIMSAMDSTFEILHSETTHNLSSKIRKKI